MREFKIYGEKSFQTQQKRVDKVFKRNEQEEQKWKNRKKC